jgi:hypothetical protein
VKRGGWPVDLAIMLLATVLATVIADLAGAKNLGTALTFGQLAFAASLVFVLLVRR